MENDKAAEEALLGLGGGGVVGGRGGGLGIKQETAAPSGGAGWFGKRGVAVGLAAPKAEGV